MSNQPTSAAVGPAQSTSLSPSPIPKTTSTTKQARNKKTYHHLKSSNKNLGTTILPVTRVTRAAKQDKDIKIVSKEAVFLISIATEFFIRKLTDSAFGHSKRERRVFVKYNDIAKAVKNNDEYQWLEDVIPISRPLGTILNDPMIPTASTAITNQLPILLLPPPTTIASTTTSDQNPPTINHESTELAPLKLLNHPQLPDTTNNHHDHLMEVDEDELDEDL